MGRRKIEIQPLTNERNRSVTFIKRKGGLFKKAHELAVLCQVDLAVIILGHNNTFYEFSSVDMRELLDQYLNNTDLAHEAKDPSSYGDYGKKSRIHVNSRQNSTTRQQRLSSSRSGQRSNNKHKRAYSELVTETDIRDHEEQGFPDISEDTLASREYNHYAKMSNHDTDSDIGSDIDNLEGIKREMSVRSLAFKNNSEIFTDNSCQESRSGSTPEVVMPSIQPNTVQNEPVSSKDLRSDNKNLLVKNASKFRPSLRVDIPNPSADPHNNLQAVNQNSDYDECVSTRQDNHIAQDSYRQGRTYSMLNSGSYGPITSKLTGNSNFLNANNQERHNSTSGAENLNRTMRNNTLGVNPYSSNSQSFTSASNRLMPMVRQQQLPNPRLSSSPIISEFPINQSRNSSQAIPPMPVSTTASDTTQYNITNFSNMTNPYSSQGYVPSSTMSQGPPTGSLPSKFVQDLMVPSPNTSISMFNDWSIPNNTQQQHKRHHAFQTPSANFNSDTNQNKALQSLYDPQTSGVTQSIHSASKNHSSNNPNISANSNANRPDANIMQGMYDMGLGTGLTPLIGTAPTPSATRYFTFASELPQDDNNDRQSNSGGNKSST